MAFPTILLDSSTGSDTAASGAGPGTALSGVAATWVGATVNLSTDAPDLSGVSTSGSDVIYINTTTGVKFFKITAKNVGAFTVDVTPSPSGSTGRAWGIGGQRLSLNNANTRLLFDNGGGTGDAKAGWTVEMQSGYTDTLNDRLLFRLNGDTTDGPFTLRGASGASVKPVLTWNTDDIALFPLGAYTHLDDFSMKNTNASKTTSEAIRSQTTNGCRIKGVTIADPTDYFFRGINFTADPGMVRSCNIGYCGSVGIRGASGAAFNVNFIDNIVHHCGSHGVDFTASGDTFLCVTIESNIVYSNGGSGILLQAVNAITARLNFRHNTIDSNTSDGVFADNTNLGWNTALIENNIFSNNGGYGWNFDNITAVLQAAYGIVFDSNDFYNNTSGKYNPADLVSSNEQTLNPTYTSASGLDFSIGTNLKALGYPTSNIGSTRSYVDIGAAQRQETSAAAATGVTPFRTTLNSIRR